LKVELMQTTEDGSLKITSCNRGNGLENMNSVLATAL
jgi:hypothetical protein